MTTSEYFLIAVAALALGLVWWFDLFCLRRTDDKFVSTEACKRFCSKRGEGCHVAPDDADRQCSDKQLLAEASEMFRSVRSAAQTKMAEKKETDTERL